MARAEYTTAKDTWRLSKEDIIGTYSLHLPGVGKVILFLQSSIGRFVLMMNVVGIFIIEYI